MRGTPVGSPREMERDLQGPKSLITNRAYRQFLSGTKEGTLALDPEKVALASQWDGLHRAVDSEPFFT